MKKIISFSVYGSDPKYTNAAIENLKLQPKIYPGWICRFYVDDKVPADIISQMRDLGSEVIEKGKANGHLAMFWRFEPLKDESIDRFIVRDSDSRLNIREASAVEEWIQSGLPFHIMRDHPQHGALICGGMWGSTKEFILEEKPKFDEEIKQYISSIPFSQIHGPRGAYFNTDQPWLWRYIWPKIVNRHLAHIKDLPNLRFTGKEKIFSTDLPNRGFVGEPFEI